MFDPKLIKSDWVSHWSRHWFKGSKVQLVQSGYNKIYIYFKNTIIYIFIVKKQLASLLEAVIMEIKNAPFDLKPLISLKKKRKKTIYYCNWTP